MSRAAWILVATLAALIGCGGEEALPLPGNYRALSPTPAPPLAALCPDQRAPPAGARVWVVFGELGCSYCRRWLATLAEAAPLLEAHGILVVYTVEDAGDCEAARRSARHVDFPVSVGSRAQSAAYGVNPTPDTVFLQDGRLVGRMLAGTNPAGVEALVAHLVP